MTLKFIKDLHRSALECRFAQLRRQTPGILFINAPLRNQRTDPDCSGPVRRRVGAIRIQHESRRSQIERGQRAIGLHVPNAEGRVFQPTDNCAPLNDRGEVCGDHRTARDAAIIGSKRFIQAYGHPAGAAQQQVATSNASGLTGHEMLVQSFDGASWRRSPVNVSLRTPRGEYMFFKMFSIAREDSPSALPSRITDALPAPPTSVRLPPDSRNFAALQRGVAVDTVIGVKGI
jgi:hypothetical protein